MLALFVCAAILWSPSLSSRVEFMKPEFVTSRNSDQVTLGLILVNINQTKTTSDMFQERLDPLVMSLAHQSTVPILLLIVTDSKTLEDVQFLLEHSIAKALTKGLLTWKKVRVPSIETVFVDIDDIVFGEEEFLAEMKSNLLEGLEATDNQKYAHDLFFIGPIYHKKFLRLERVIFIDLDLVFHADIEELQVYFLHLSSDSGRCLAITTDLSPHYWRRLEKFRMENPESRAGEVGPLTQGLNSGVALFDLACLRQSKVYNAHLEPGAVTKLVERFSMPLSLGDQDWFTMLAWQEPTLFQPLPCVWNYQKSLQYLTDPKAAPVFLQYNYCGLPHTAKIEHIAGCGPKVEHCRPQQKSNEDKNQNSIENDLSLISKEDEIRTFEENELSKSSKEDENQNNGENDLSIFSKEGETQNLEVNNLSKILTPQERAEIILAILGEVFSRFIVLVEKIIF